MARNRKTLSDLFAPPVEGLLGIHALLCAYSADADFLIQALDKFTGVGRSSRLARGSVDATLALDPEHAVFEAQMLPGLCQLYPRPPESRPWRFRRMHAKVALLAFGKCRAGEPTHYRMVVSTGNWTTTSARHLIELAWYADVPAESKDAPDLRDLHACATFFENLLGCYQANPALTIRAMDIVRLCLARGKGAGSKSVVRFSSNFPVRTGERPQSLLRRLVAAAMEDGSARNLLVCGSGFYEKDAGTDQAPEVIGLLSDALRKKGLLTANPETVVVLNPEFGGQVARHVKDASNPSMAIYRPKDPVGGERSPRTKLHAKFCYIGKLRSRGITSGLLYLGSGNLTFPGFVQHPEPADHVGGNHGGPGNIEAGVFIRTNVEQGSARIETWAKLQRLLPIGSRLKPGDVEVGSENDEELEEMQKPSKPAPPIMAFTLGHDNSLTVLWSSEPTADEAVEVDIPDRGTVTVPFESNQVPLDAAIAVQWLTVRANGVEWRVPCLCPTGEYPRCASRTVTFANWLDELDDFPGSWNDPAADNPDGDDGDEAAGGSRGPAGPPDCSLETSADRNFPAHTAALLVESIARQNGEVAEDRREDYLAHLRRALLHGLPPGYLEEWRALKVNFLTPLLSREGFAPDWKDLGSYDQFVNNVIDAWGFRSFPSLGMMP